MTAINRKSTFGSCSCFAVSRAALFHSFCSIWLLMKRRITPEFRLHRYLTGILLCLTFLIAHSVLAAQAAQDWQQTQSFSDLARSRIAHVFPGADSVSEPQGDFEVRVIAAGDELLGYAFQSLAAVN